MKRRVGLLLTMGAGAVLALPVPAGAGGGCHLAAAEAAAKTGGVTTVAMERMCFTPGVIEVRPGTAVRFVNRDSVPHVVGGTGWGEFEGLATGAAFQHTFSDQGVYAYSCFLHPSMNGAVVVTEADGSRPRPMTPVGATVEQEAGFDRASVGLGATAGAVVAAGAAGLLRRRRRPLSSRP